jgi:hypothetical protein
MHVFVTTPIASGRITTFTDFSISGEGVSTAQEVLWNESVKNAQRMIIRGQTDYTLDVALILLVVTGIVWAVVTAGRRIEWERARKWIAAQWEKFREFVSFS